MPDPGFDRLEARLLRSGIARRHVVRAVAELRDHFEDLEIEAAELGLHPAAAAKLASKRIGTIELIANQYLERTELKCWIYRCPQLARVIFPLVYVILLPSIPIVAGIQNAPVIAKWCACLLLSGLVTATMLLVMQLSITLT